MKFYQKLTWKFLQLTYGVYIKKNFHISCIKNFKEPKPPFILLANHFFFSDAFFIAKFLKNPVHYLGSDEITNFFQQILDNLVGLLYIEKGKIDPKAVMKMFKIIKAGGSIGIFPEGDGSWDGETNHFSDKIIKLIKRFNVPIITVRITGGYLTKPRWSSNFRSGKIKLEFDKIDQSEIELLNEKELYQNIYGKIYNNELKNPEVNEIEYKSNNLAEGIHNLLWKCPVCEFTDSIMGVRNKIICTRCKTEWELSGNMKIHPHTSGLKDLKDWSEWQKHVIKNIVSDAKKGLEGLTQSFGVEVHEFDVIKKGFFRSRILYKKYADGNILLTKENLIFTPVGNEKKIVFPVKEIKFLVECVNKFIKFYYDNKPYLIKFKNMNSSKYIYFIEELNKPDFF